MSLWPPERNDRNERHDVIYGSRVKISIRRVRCRRCGRRYDHTQRIVRFTAGAVEALQAVEHSISGWSSRGIRLSTFRHESVKQPNFTQRPPPTTTTTTTGWKAAVVRNQPVRQPGGRSGRCRGDCRRCRPPTALHHKFRRRQWAALGTERRRASRSSEPVEAVRSLRCQSTHNQSDTGLFRPPPVRRRSWPRSS